MAKKKKAKAARAFVFLVRSCMAEQLSRDDCDPFAMPTVARWTLDAAVDVVEEEVKREIKNLYGDGKTPDEIKALQEEAEESGDAPMTVVEIEKMKRAVRRHDEDSFERAGLRWIVARVEVKQ